MSHNDTFDPLNAAKDSDTKYRFVPVVRRGFPPQQAYDAAGVMGEASIPASGRVQVDLRATGAGSAPNDQLTGDVQIDMYGPGHVTGIDGRQVVRTEPEPETTNYPPNYFPAVEFDAADFPWLFSPVADDTYASPAEVSAPTGRGLPWCCLVVVEKDSEVGIEPAGSKPNPVLEAPVAELPPLDEAWAWAHAQVVGSPARKDGVSLDDVFSEESTLTRSRLLAPRKLEPSTEYIAAVVPVFDAGRKAGLGQPTEEEPGTNRTTMDLAWDPAKTSAADSGASGETVRLPSYYHWEFSTGERGDFEFLVRELESVELNSDAYDVGFAEVDVTDPGPAMLDDLTNSPREDRTVRLGGAIRKVDATADEYAKRAQLRDLLNTPSSIVELDDLVEAAVGPPIYGGRHAQVEQLPASPQPEREWLWTLNLHPGWRLAAAAGTAVVQDHQEALMAAAWEQVGEIRAANRRLAAAQLSQESMERKLRKLSGASDEWLAQFTAPMHDRVLTDDGTVGSMLAASGLPRGLASAPFRRLTGGSGRLADRLDSPIDGPGILAGVADGSLDITSPADAPDGMGTPEQEVDIVSLCREFGNWREQDGEPIEPADSVTELLESIADMVENLVAILELLDALVEGDREATMTAERERAEGRWSKVQNWADPLQNLMVQVAREEATAAQERPGGLPTIADSFTLGRANTLHNQLWDVLGDALFPQTGESDGDGEALDASAVRAAQAAVFEVVLALAAIEAYFQVTRGQDPLYISSLVCSPDPSKVSDPVPDLAAIRTAFDPINGLIERMGSQLEGIDLRNRGRPPLDRVMAYPEFPTPMYEDLKELSPDYLLPGVDEIPANSVGALETNPQFIEAFMLGLNHEMASELRWRRYPTDSRGSYFRQFWDPSARVPKPDDPDLLYDITEIHTWDGKAPAGTASPLGSNVMTGAPGDDPTTPPGQGATATTNVVLVVRGELLRRYPSTTIYATKAKEVTTEDGNDTVRVPHWPTAEQAEAQIDDTYHKFPIFRGTLEPDVTFLGFSLTAEKATGETETPTVVDTPPEDPSMAKTDGLGWYFVFEEPPGEVRFGLDVNQDDIGTRPNGITYDDPSGPDSPDSTAERKTATTANAAANPEYGWNGMSFGHLVDTAEELSGKDNVSIYRDRPWRENWETVAGTAWTTDGTVADDTIDDEEVAVWGKNSAHMAYATWQRPVRVAIHADDLLPTAGGE